MGSYDRVRSYGEGLTVPPQVIGHVKYTSPSGVVYQDPNVYSDGGLSPEEARCWDSVSDPPYHAGKTFLLRKYTRPSTLSAGGGVFIGANQILGGSSNPHAGGTTPWSYQYEGSFSNPAPNGFDDSFFSSGFATDPTHNSTLHPDDGSSVGATAYNKMRPKPETFNLLQAAAELKDVPSMLKETNADLASIYQRILIRKTYGSSRTALRDAIRMPSKLGDEYLAAAFGWRPFLSDLSNLFGLVDRVGVHIANRKKYNNVWISRRRSEPESRTETVVHSSQSGVMQCKPSLGSSGSNNYILPNSSKYTITLEKSTNIWYSGWFKSYRPEFDDSYERQHPTLAKPRQVLTSLGYYVNPIVLYKLTPWTWMSDWFLNIGENLQSFQDLADNSVVSRNVCMMRHIVSKLVYRINATLRLGGSISLEWNRGFETKYRAAGLSPFGFSLLPGGFSDQQIAILGALGMSKFL
jgi:hypothetical protein